MFDGFKLIHAYTRSQAIEDGVLIDISSLATEAGIRYPVTVTAALYHEYIEPSPDLQAEGQSATGRLWDLLILFRSHALRSANSTIQFNVLFKMAPGKPPELITVKSICHPGDTPKPVIIIMLPHED